MKSYENIIKILKKICNNIWFKTSILIFALISLYFIRENFEISRNTNIMLNLIFIGVFLVTFYQRLYIKKVSIIRFVIIVLVAFIINKFYDPDIFFNTFNVKLVVIVCGIGILILGYIVLSKVFNVVCTVMKENTQRRDGPSKEKNSDDKDGKEIGYNGTNIENECRYPQNTRKRGKIKTKTHIIKSDVAMRNQETLSRKILSSNLFTICIFMIIFLFPVIFIIFLFDQDLIKKFEGIKVYNLINVGISLMGLLFLCIFMWTVVIGFLIKLIQTIFDIINRQNSQNSYLLNASAFLIVSLFITKQFDISLDKIIDELVQGNIFSFPLSLIILLPLFFTFLQNLEKLIIKDSRVKTEITEQLHSIIFSIIIALLNFIKFTTADFLTSIQDIVKADLEDNNAIPHEVHKEDQVQENQQLNQEISDLVDEELNEQVPDEWNKQTEENQNE